MTFTPDTDTNNLAYLYARSLIKGEDLANWDLAIEQYFMTQCTAGTTLVTNSGTTAAPNGSIAAAIAAANLLAKSGNRNF
jgi:hypothetical protein